MIERIDLLLDLVRLKTVDIKNGKRINADHGYNFHPFANHITKQKNFTKVEIYSVSILTVINV